MRLEGLKAYFNSLSPLSSGEFASFSSGLRLSRFKKHETFTTVGDIHDRVGFVAEGVFKVYYSTSEGRSIIRNFCIEGSPIGSFATILTKQPAHVTIEALEDSIIFETSFEHLASYFERGIAWQKLGRRIAELHYISREKREFQLLSLDASERYEAFKIDFPGLEDRVNQSDIASFLGVDPATLSRIRRKKFSKSSD
ncbi:MAG: Crp/Fnr family transcriptional regulator [Pseudobacteriovorax sp.]|nr:Crp/Fnr family transcriptional regulator [Pseudobacteriovorax sp.]